MMEARNADTEAPAPLIGADGQSMTIPELIVHTTNDFMGNTLRSNLNHPYVGTHWDSQLHIRSVIIIAGTWTFFEGEEYQGRSVERGPGYHPNFPDFNAKSFKVSQ